MRKPVLAALFPAGLLALAGCDEEIDLGVQESPSIVAEEESAGAEETPIFRGVGQEPGWLVRIYDDVIMYDADYGERRVTARTPEVEEFDGGRRYENDSIIVEILDQPCTDTMSGAAYPAKVTITETGLSPVQGCGGTP
ncbi:hypothetical protein [Parasphingopyxis lamellibrachiae]|uniref:Putative membrane protein n=1 Tax=Parasphingopyxis lamellibrachiae TaxID=680125 RepID=A0A3D9FEZ6_9SPHN|nr:hypothetical protein [Parasphingopyxis lamellibrachiae]RED15656.1 putative membrane protein [Parasphingopyxis lamellibrachiae]